ncbi:MAG: dienelactone hydrolase family protein [Moraxellaceae bacterium]
MSRFLRTLILSCLALFSLPALAEIKTREIPYEAADGSKLLGYYAFDDSIKGKRPGIVVVHEWWGLNDYARRRARELAALGYAALAIDMYGEGKHTEHKSEAMEMMHGAAADSKISMARAQAGLDLLKAQTEVDADKLAAIGYCFGGKIVLDMARQGMALAGVVSFHGVLATAAPAQKGIIKARVLVLNGDADKFIPESDISAIKKEMKAAGADFTFVGYPDAKHAFTSTDADRLGKDNGMDIAYNAKADKASWKKMQGFLESLFTNRESRKGGY